MEAEGSGFQSQPQLNNELEVCLAYMRLCLQKQNKTNIGYMKRNYNRTPNKNDAGYLLWEITPKTQVSFRSLLRPNRNPERECVPSLSPLFHTLSTYLQPHPNGHRQRYRYVAISPYGYILNIDTSSPDNAVRQLFT